jgi:hypothetical protein
MIWFDFDLKSISIVAILIWLEIIFSTIDFNWLKITIQMIFEHPEYDRSGSTRHHMLGQIPFLLHMHAKQKFDLLLRWHHSPECILNHGLATEDGRRTSFPPLRYGCQMQPENQNNTASVLGRSSMVQFKMYLGRILNEQKNWFSDILLCYWWTICPSKTDSVK